MGTLCDCRPKAGSKTITVRFLGHKWQVKLCSLLDGEAKMKQYELNLTFKQLLLKRSLPCWSSFEGNPWYNARHFIPLDTFWCLHSALVMKSSCLFEVDWSANEKKTVLERNRGAIFAIRLAPHWQDSPMIPMRPTEPHVFWKGYFRTARSVSVWWQENMKITCQQF